MWSKLFTTLAFILIFGRIVLAQQWQGSSDTTGSIYRNGRIGLGLSNPQYPINIFSTVNDDHVARVDWNNTTNGLHTWRHPFVGYWSDMTLGKNIAVEVGQSPSLKNTAFMSFHYDGYSSDKNYLQLGLFFVDSLFVMNGARNIGINTTNPQYPLNIFSTVNDDHVVRVDWKNTVNGLHTWRHPFVGYWNDMTPGKNIAIEVGQSPSLKNTAFMSFHYVGPSSDDNYLQLGLFLVNDAFVINGLGNIGIGLVTPDNNYKLTVNGKIKTKELKVTSTGWPDFVFEENYQLPSLMEVENYIKEHKRLSGIPSAEHVEKEGIAVGEIQSKLLQKIEELTLYVIEQNKKYETLNKKYEELQERVSK